jgi:hypothetical protein
VSGKIEIIDATVFSFKEGSGLRPGDLCWIAPGSRKYDKYGDLEYSAFFPEDAPTAQDQAPLHRPRELTHRVVRCLGERPNKVYVNGRWISKIAFFVELEPLKKRRVLQKKEKCLVGSTISQRAQMIVFDAKWLELPYGVRADDPAYLVTPKCRTTKSGQKYTEIMSGMTYGEAFAVGRLHVVDDTEYGLWPLGKVGVI